MKAVPILAASALVSLVACQQTPILERNPGAERASYSEWTCDGEKVLAQFYGARVVISDSRSSRWLDRGTQVGKVFRAENAEFRFRGDSATWTRGDQTSDCEVRPLPEEWQEAKADMRGPLRFMARGEQPQWLLKITDKDVFFEVPQEEQYRRLPASEPDYYLDMWTYDIQTREDRMRVQITDGLCRDPRTSEPYPSTVRATWNDQVFRGCGRWLAKGDYRP
ncbi:hypothetical protein CWE09_08710 [Aliidiomarina minuta]|uniref:C-type lysozyme inhibitor domain-containing protein n=1 Tax=Aliidiomarina minuta TaxID=880057 RepID=A0A432W9M8_9GAMM|nr:hypothetical protein [Aliidiomarina minuta]RUO26761.1 hypothetical protein CWE09_08710 [Aliidiomarina minuta]